MTLERAIEILEELLYGLVSDRQKEAIKLGTEALKKWQDWREAPYIHGVLSPLPGETEGE